MSELVEGLRVYLDDYNLTQAVEEFEEEMEANDEVLCFFKTCNFKITRKQYEKGDDSNDLWDHLYTHCDLKGDYKEWMNRNEN